MIVGSIVLEMAADLARLTADMATGSSIVQRGAKKIEDMAGLAGKALGLIGVSLSASAFANWIQGAIDGADAASKMAAKTSLAVDEVAGLQLAFELGGSSSEGMATAMAKLSKKMVEGDAAFDTLGVATYSINGSMLGTKDVFYAVADAFQELESGAAKTALAQQLFGKSGAELLPLLNGGSEGLQDMADKAAKLGLVLDSETAAGAEQFNDTVELLGKGLSGVATRTMAQLLPTLNSLTDAFFDSMTEGDALAKISNALAAALKLLFSGGVVVVEIFSTIGKTIGAAGAQIVAVMQGDFKGAARIGQDYAQDVKTGWSNTAETLAKVWDESGSKTVENLGAVQKAQKALRLQSESEAAASKKLAEQQAAESKKKQDDYTKLRAKMLELGEALDAEHQKGAKLSDLEKQAIQIKREYTGVEQAQLLAILAANVAKDERNRLEEAAAKATEEARKASVAAVDQARKDVATLAEQIEAQRAANAALGGAKEATEQLSIAKLLDAAASADRKAMVALERNEDEALYEQLKLQAAGFRELAELKEQGIHIKAAKDAAAEWAKVTDEIGKGLTDSLFRAFEAGKGFFRTLWDGIKNTIKTTALKVLIQPVQGAMGSLLGMGSGSAAAGQAGGLGSLMSMGSKLWDGAKNLMSGGSLDIFGSSGMSWLTDFGGSVGTATSKVGGWLFDNGAEGLGNWLGSNQGVISDFAGIAGDALGYFGALKSAADGKWGAAAGSAIGTWFGGPVGAAIGNALGGLADKIFAGGAGTPHRGAMYMSDGKTGYVPGASVVGDMAWGDSVYKNRDQGVEDSLKLMTGASAGILNALSGVFGGTGGFKVGAYWSADNHDPSQGNTRIWQGDSILSSTSQRFATDGKTGFAEYTALLAGQVRNAMGQIQLPEWARKAIDGLASSASLDELANSVQQIAATKLALQGVSDAMAPLGGVFGRIAGLSGDAVLELAGFAGGIDALMAKTRSYVDAYYSVDEKNAIAAAAIQRQLTAAGITERLGSKADLRELIENSAVGSTAERQRVAALLEIAQSFAPVGEYLEAQGKTLDQLAASAPQVALLQQQVDAQTSQVNAAQQTVSAVNLVNTSIVSMQSVLSAALANVSSKLDTVAAVSESSARFIADSFSSGQARLQP